MNRSHLQSFFIELAAVLLFFSFAAAIDLKLFAAGGRLSRESQELNGAVLAAQSLAEGIAAGQPPQDAVYYDEGWAETAAPGAFSAEIAQERVSAGAGALARYTITVSRADGTPLYTLHTSKYWQEEGDR